MSMVVLITVTNCKGASYKLHTCELILFTVQYAMHCYHRHLTKYSRLRLGFSLLYKTVFHLNCLTAQLSCEGRAVVEGAK
jgi:hypothetical protein